MKSKFIGIGICFMLLTTVLVSATPLNRLHNTSTITQPASATMVDVPVWTIGNSWTYQINDISINYTSDTQTILLHGSLSEIPLTVINTTGDYYTLHFETTMDGLGYINAVSDEGPINISIAISDLALQGNVLIQKSNLGIKDITVSFENQKISFNIIDQPFITLPSWLHIISAKFTSDLDVNIDISVALLSFPFNTGMYWDLVATSFSLNGQIQSKLFNLLHFLNNFAKLFGVTLLPDEIASLLPIINMHDALNTFVGTNVFDIPGFPGVFYCPATETVTVPAGTFEAYNITLLGGIGHCYYAPSAGSIIKLQGNFADLIPFVESVDMTLLDTSYT
jgi:hypothetical protein